MPYQPNPFPENLSEDQFRTGYHGSPHDLIGTHIDPEIGSSRKTWEMSSTQHVNYQAANLGMEGKELAASHHRAEALAWGWAITKQTRPERANRSRVYKGVAEGSIGGDQNLDEYPRNWYQAGRPPPNAPAMAADRFRVTDTVWTPPPERGEQGVQGTIPNVNWNQFGAPNSVGTDPNRFPATMGWTSGDYAAQAESDIARDRALTEHANDVAAEHTPYVNESVKHQQLKLSE